MSFSQFISEYVDWDVLRREFSDVPELEDFLHEESSIYVFS